MRWTWTSCVGSWWLSCRRRCGRAMSRSGCASPIASYRVLIACLPGNFPSKEFPPMMGTKARHFAPLIHVSVEELVPHDHFYRHLERTLDLSFVREFVHETYAGGGRPSIDPVVFFKLQLVMFFEGIRSERQLMRHAADRLSVLWYLGYDLGEPLPDHSSLTRIRERYGVDIFRRFFEKMVEQCQQAGLVWGRELYIDGTKVEANASLDSLKPRFAVEAHLTNLFPEETEPPAQQTEQNWSQEAASNAPSEQK